MPLPLTDTELQRLDALLAAPPAALQPLDAVTAEGFLCGVLVQTRPVACAQWLALLLQPEAARDAVAGSGTLDLSSPWAQAVQALLQRHHDTLRESLAEGLGFEPWLPQDPLPAGDDDPEQPEAARLVWPWVAGFVWAWESLADPQGPWDEEFEALHARLWRYLPAVSEYERDARDAWWRQAPPASPQDAITDLVDAIQQWSDKTEALRYHVATVRRAAPKVGRNDPCSCGSGRKYKQCCGA
jgi:uncharacterized protein